MCTCFSMSKDAKRVLLFGISYALVVGHFVLSLIAGADSLDAGGHRRFSGGEGVRVDSDLVRAHLPNESRLGQFLRIFGDLISGDRDWEQREYFAIVALGLVALISGAIIFTVLLLVVGLCGTPISTTDDVQTGDNVTVKSAAANAKKDVVKSKRHLYQQSTHFLVLTHVYAVSCFAWAIAAVVFIEAKFRKGNGYFHASEPQELHLVEGSRLANVCFWALVGLVPMVGAGGGLALMCETGILCCCRKSVPESGEEDAAAPVGKDEALVAAGECFRGWKARVQASKDD